MKNRILLYTALLITALFTSCQKNSMWDDFYYKGTDKVNSGTIMDVLEKTNGVAKFTNALKETGVDSILVKDQLYTVFAFNDEQFDLLPDNIKNNPVLLKMTMLFHVYYNKMVSNEISEGLYKTLAGKYSLLEKVNDSLVINETSHVIDGDLLALNGVIHIIDKPTVPNPNLYQFLQMDPEFELFINYIADQKIVTFDRDNSEIIGFNEYGNPIYDSVWVSHNTFLDKYPIDSEDDQFTMLIPTGIKKAIEEVKQGVPFNGDVPDDFFVEPVMETSLLSGVYRKEELNSGLLTVSGKNLSQTLLDLIAEDDEGTPLSNGRAFVVDGYVIPRDVVYAPVVLNKKQMYGSAHKSSGVYKIGNDRIFWIPTNWRVKPEQVYGEYVDFIIKRNFLPLNYKFFIDLRPYGGGKIKIEVNGVEVPNSPLWVEEVGDDPGHYDVDLGVVSFNQVYKEIVVRITFLEQHKKEGVGWTGKWNKQYMLSNGMRFEPITE